MSTLDRLYKIPKEKRTSDYRRQVFKLLTLNYTPVLMYCVLGTSGLFEWICINVLCIGTSMH